MWLIPFIIASIFLPIHDLGSTVLSQQGFYQSGLDYVSTYQEIISWGMVLTVVSASTVVLVTMTLSYFTRNVLKTIIPIFLILFVPMFVLIGIFFDNMWIDFMAFAKVVMFMELFTFGNEYYGIPYLVLQGQVIAMYYVMTFSYIVCSVITMLIMIWHSKKHIVHNR